MTVLEHFCLLEARLEDRLEVYYVSRARIINTMWNRLATFFVSLQP